MTIKDFLKQEIVTRDDILLFSKQLKIDCNNVYFKFATGVGKTKIALETTYGKTLILCERITHIKSWEDEIIKHKVEGDFTVICYKSVHKHLEESWDNVIIDEVDACLGEIALEQYKLLITNSWTFLSADADKEHIKKMKSLCSFETFEINLKKAIKWNILPEPEYKWIPLLLDNKEVKYKVPDIKGIFTYQEKNKVYTQLGLNNLLLEKIEYWKNQADEKGWGTKIKPSFEAMTCFKLGNFRKQFYSQIKLDYFNKNIKPNLENKRYITFVGNIELVKTLKNNIHSKKSNKENAEILERFNNEEINNLNCVDILTRGVNLSSCDVGIILKLDFNSNFTKLKQQIGRILRSDNPIVYILYLEGKEANLVKKYINQI